MLCSWNAAPLFSQTLRRVRLRFSRVLFFPREPRVIYLETVLLSSSTTSPPLLLVAKQMQEVAQDIENNVSAPVAEVIAPAERTTINTTADANETERKSSCRSVCLRLLLALPLLALGAASLCISAYLFTVRLVGFPPSFIPYPCDPECGFLSMYNTIRNSSFVDGLCTFSGQVQCRPTGMTGTACLVVCEIPPGRSPALRPNSWGSRALWIEKVASLVSPL